MSQSRSLVRAVACVVPLAMVLSGGAAALAGTSALAGSPAVAIYFDSGPGGLVPDGFHLAQGGGNEDRLAITGTTDGSNGVSVASVDLRLDGTVAASIACGPPAGPGVDVYCPLGYLLVADDLSVGMHTLQGQLTTTAGDTVNGALLHITVDPAVVPAVLTLSPGGTVGYGGVASAHGRVVSAGTGQPLAGAAVEVTFAPYFAASSIVTVWTSADGSFTAAAPFRLTSNTAVSASTGTAAPASTRIGVTVPIRCTVPPAAQHAVTTWITCHADHLAFHSVLALRISSASSSQPTLWASTNAYGNVSFPEVFAHAGHELTLTATTATTYTFTASSSPAYQLWVW